MNTLFLMTYFTIKGLKKFYNTFSHGGHTGHGAGVCNLPVFLCSYLLQSDRINLCHLAARQE
jgi:hypothetical protein